MTQSTIRTSSSFSSRFRSRVSAAEAVLVSPQHFRASADRAAPGAAWPAKGGSEDARECLSVMLDDPSFPEPIYATLFDNKEGARIVWSRRRETA